MTKNRKVGEKDQNKKQIHFDLTKNKIYLFESEFVEHKPEIQDSEISHLLAGLKDTYKSKLNYAITLPKYIQPLDSEMYPFYYKSFQDFGHLSQSIEFPSPTSDFPIIVTKNYNHIYMCAWKCKMCTIL